MRPSSSPVRPPRRARRCRTPPPARRRSERERSSALAELADASLLADLAAQVIELRAVHVADLLHLDLVDLRRMQRERTLDANAERVLPDGERLTCTGTLPLDHDPLEDLDPLAGPFDHAEMHAHGVARLELRDFAQLTALDVLDDGAHGEEGPKAATIVADLVMGGRSGGRASRPQRRARRSTRVARSPTTASRRSCCGCRRARSSSPARRRSQRRNVNPARPPERTARRSSPR